MCVLHQTMFLAIRQGTQAGCRERLHARGGSAGMEIVLQNCTSLMAHWTAILRCPSDIVVLVETRVTRMQQCALRDKAKSRGLCFEWGAPVRDSVEQDRNGLLGKSGGVAVLTGNGWRPTRVDLGVELEAPLEYWQAFLVERDATSDQVVVVAYYGHPIQKSRTVRDLLRLREIVRASTLPIYIAADLNLDLEPELAAEVWIDVGLYWDQKYLAHVRSTFAGSHGVSRVDYLLAPAFVREAICDYKVEEAFGIAGHSAVRVRIAGRMIREKVSRALPAIKVKGKNEQFDTQAAIRQAQVKWNDAIVSGVVVDELYLLWSALWEDYLICAHHQAGHVPRGRGCLQEPKMQERSTLRRKAPRDLTRLAKYVKRVEKLLHASGKYMHPGERAALWQKVSSHSATMARNYGTPDELPLQGTPQEVERLVLLGTLKHYRKAHKAYLAHLDAEDRMRWKEKLYRNGGINKDTAAYLSEKWLASPQVLRGTDVITDPCEILKDAEREWAKYFAAEPSGVNEEWTRCYLSDIRHHECPLPMIDEAMLKAALRSAKTEAAASMDSWRYAEMRELPSAALQQLAHLYNLSEAKGRLPFNTLQSWTALVGAANPVLPLKLRPIALLSTTWRLYATVRYRSISSWIQKIFPESMNAYIEGRGTQTATQPLIREVEDKQLKRQCGASDQLHVLALDATKAFPSVSRRQIWAILRRAGLPHTLIEVIEDMYNRGRTRFRVGGRIAAEVDHPLQRGVHQGCPLSVVFFNAIQLPIVKMIEKEHKTIGVSVYADDIVIYGPDLAELVIVFEKIAKYYKSTGIQLNPGKTAYWSIGGDQQTVQLDGCLIARSSRIKVLGVTFDMQTQNSKDADAAAGLFKSHLERLARLPLSLEAKQRLLAAVTLPKINHDGWINAWSPKLLTSLRAALIGVLKPALASGPRAQAAVVMLCLKAHRVDPMVSQLWRLLAEVRRAGSAASRLVLAAMWWESPISGPYSKLASELRALGFVPAPGDDGVILPGFKKLTFSPQHCTLPEWQHLWREVLKDSALRKGTAHRSDFANLEGVSVDWPKTLKWHHGFVGIPSHRTALELVLTGGMLTNDRVHRRAARKSDQNCPWGCRRKDTQIHRFWSCRRFSELRQVWNVSDQGLEQITKCCGIFPQSDDLCQSRVLRIQGYMSAVMREAAADSYRDKHGQERAFHWGEASLEEQDTEHCDSGVRGRPAGVGSGSRSGHETGRKEQTSRGHIQARVLGVTVPMPSKKKQGRPKADRGPLPPHIVQFFRKDGNTLTSLASLRCVNCGGVGLATHTSRFVTRHLGCTETECRHTVKRRLTVAEAKALSDKAGEDIASLGKWKRRRLMSLLL